MGYSNDILEGLLVVSEKNLHTTEDIVGRSIYTLKHESNIFLSNLFFYYDCGDVITQWNHGFCQ